VGLVGHHLGGCDGYRCDRNCRPSPL